MSGGVWGTPVLLALAGCGPSHASTHSAPDLILVSMDTLRADRLGAYGNKDGLTPNLDRFAAESVLFEHAYSQATTTAPSHAALFSSHYPSEQTSSARQPEFGKDKPTLAEVLHVYDYQTGAFVGGADLNPHMGLTAGFDAYNSPRDFGSLWHSVPGALAWMRQRDPERPFFAFVHGYDAHARYLKPPPYGYAHADASYTGVGQDAARTAPWRIIDGQFYPDLDAFMRVNEMFLRPRDPIPRAKMLEFGEAGPAPLVPVGEEDIAVVRGTYDGATMWGDAQFGAFMAGLSDLGLLETTTIVMVADHGEQLGEYGLIQHCCGIHDEETHVPLMIRLPGGAGGGKRIVDPVGLIDVMPTLVTLAGGKVPAGVHGQSLVPLLRGEPFVPRTEVFTQGDDRMRSVSARSLHGRLTYTGVTSTSALLPELIESARIDGPAFTGVEGDGAGGAMDPTERLRLRDALVVWLRTLTASPKDRPDELPQGLRNELRKHGYFDVAP